MLNVLSRDHCGDSPERALGLCLTSDAKKKKNLV